VPPDRRLWQDVLEGLRLRLGRTLLAAGAIALGACALTVLLGAVSGLQSHANNLARILGNNTIALVDTSAGKFRSDGLQTHYAQLLADNLIGVEVSTMRSDNTLANGRDRHLTLIATDQNLADVRGWRIVAGRFIDAGDVMYGARNMVITSELSSAWNWHVGDVVNIRQTAFVIIGIVETPAANLEVTALAPDVVVHDMSAFIPRTVLPTWLDIKFAPSAQVDSIYMHLPAGESINPAIERSDSLLIAEGVPLQQMVWITTGSLTAGLNSLRDMVAAVAGGVTLLSMILGGITLTSLMISNVRDRIPEIGLRRTFGAMPKDIAALFVVEALLLTLFAAGAGMVAAVLLLTVGPRLPLPVQLNALTLLGPLAMGGLLGALSAWWPAHLAIQIEPAQALRQQ
jgi:putative ABC transport system permease protein